jgi:hypothetical protein
LLALRIEDAGPDHLRIDEAVKEKEKGTNRIGETKTETSDAWVAVPPDLARDLKAWVARHPQRSRSESFPVSDLHRHGIPSRQFPQAGSEADRQIRRN